MFQVNIADWMANGKCFTKCHTTLGLWYVITVILLIRPNLSGSPILPLLLFDATVSVNITNARFYHNAGKCEQFIYGGCRGNENNFASLEACQVPGDFWNVFFNLIFSLFSALLGKMHCRSTGGCRRRQVPTWRPELQQRGHRQVGQPRCVLGLCEFDYMLLMET